METQLSTLALSIEMQSTPTIAAERLKPLKLAKLSRPKLKESSRPLTQKTFVERPKKRRLEKGAEMSNCANAWQKNSLGPVQRNR